MKAEKENMGGGARETPGQKEHVTDSILLTKSSKMPYVFST